jgi:hypothetical protein
MTQYTSCCAASRPWPKPTLSTSLIPTVRSIPNPDICAWFPQTRVYAVLLMMAVQNPGISAIYKPNPGISAISEDREVKPGYIRNLPYQLLGTPNGQKNPLLSERAYRLTERAWAPGAPAPTTASGPTTAVRTPRRERPAGSAPPGRRRGASCQQSYT